MVPTFGFLEHHLKVAPMGFYCQNSESMNDGIINVDENSMEPRKNMVSQVFLIE